MYTGDIATGREIFPEQLKIIDVFTGWINSDGVVEPPSEHWNFFDWSYGLNGIDYDGKITSLLNFFYIMALKDCVQLGELLGVQVAIENYRRLIGKVKNATLRRFYRNGRFFDFVDADGTLGCSSRLAHALALLSGEFEAQNPLAGLLDEKLLNPEFYFHLFIFKALAKAGRETEALHAIRKYWGKNVMTGTPSIWESGIHGNGKKAFGEAGSLCHGFATAPIDFFQTSILGIVPVEPGFKVFKVNPVPLDLEFARGRVPTLWGNINIAWEKENGRLAVELRVPAGLTAVTAVRKFKEGKHEFELNIEKDI
jgi:hypothetical protein